jgi:hypothetical protein
MAIDLTASGPSLAESTTFRERIALVAREIESGNLLLGFPLVERAREFSLSGEEAVPALVEALGQGEMSERIFAATTFFVRPDPAGVPNLIAAYEHANNRLNLAGRRRLDTQSRLVESLAYRSLEALAVSGDERAHDLLASILRGASPAAGDPIADALDPAPLRGWQSCCLAHS